MSHRAQLVLPFTEFHIVETIKSVAFSDYLLSLDNVLLTCLYVVSWLTTSFLFNAE